MYFQIVLIRKWIITNMTTKWMKPTMQQLMCLQMTLTRDFLHTSQWYGCSPVYTNRCVFRWLLPVSEWLLTNVTVIWMFTTVYCWWLFRLHLLLNDLPQVTGIRVLPSVCILVPLQVTLTSEWLLTNVTEIWKLPLCNSLSFFKLPLAVNELLHMSQAKGQSPLCISWCVFKTLLLLNDLLHTSQVWERSIPLLCCGLSFVDWRGNVSWSTSWKCVYSALGPCWSSLAGSWQQNKKNIM
jgi:hypothetical protein